MNILKGLKKRAVEFLSITLSNYLSKNSLKKKINLSEICSLDRTIRSDLVLKHLESRVKTNYSNLCKSLNYIDI